MQAPRPIPQPAPRSCIVCTEVPSQGEQALIKPCRSCPSDYCSDCLADMFRGAINDSSRWPPRCCDLIQLHTAVACLSKDDVARYRSKLEEFMTVDKVYCPAPACSTFISEKLLPKPSTGTSEISLKAFLTGVLENVTGHSVSRFFRGELPIDQLPGYAAVIPKPMDLSMMKNKLTTYQATSAMTADMKLIVANAKAYNGLNHPVAKTADELFDVYLGELAAATDRVIAMAADTKLSDHFVCPDCHIAICSKCRQIYHGSAACDTSTQDYELAMLEQFRYKRCPLCKMAVKKMYGCSHMQCSCGAHWCYYCQKSIDECDGTCEERAQSDDEEEYDDEDDEEDSEIGDGEIREDAVMTDPADRSQDANHAGQAPAQIPGAAIANSTPQDHARPTNRIVDLDRGPNRWAEGDYDFGDEPEDDGRAQIWACQHNFEKFGVPDDRNHGDLSRMECNKCFEPVQASAHVPPTVTKAQKSAPMRALDKLLKGREKNRPAAVLEEKVVENVAWECVRCKLLVCEMCRDRYKTQASNP